ncbi:hypothetical protein BRD15_04680 [Halobacteriales archaeon SW_6_65_15]|jgi:hypothetical protein|nr:MAG: hypothetical protein BRD15_04680 [Halobacteriales archaeon SW_6_65_15]
MGFGSKRWECKDCGRRHHTDRKQCVECGYSVLTPVDDRERVDRFSTVVLALLPAILSILTMGLLAWVLFFS